MEIGAFSVSLAVKDLSKSKAFYETLGFNVFAGEQDQNYLIMKNGESLIGLFQGMFEENILTFNPGWDQSANSLASFTDARDILKHLSMNGISPVNQSVDADTGPANFSVVDPDGNVILIDQHV